MAMKLLLFLLVAGVMGFRLEPHVSAAQNQTCGKYACPPQGFNMTQGTCGQLVNGTYYLAACSPLNTTFCNTTTLKCQANPAAVVLPSWPGEPCSTQQTCMYGTCQLNKCKGMFAGAPCSLNDQCDPGLHCNSTGLCSPQLLVGSIGCQSEYDCVNGADCNATLPTNGTCLAYASVPNGSWVTDCGNGFSRLCKSGACQQKLLFTKTGVCIDAAKSIAPTPQACSKDNDCVGTNTLNYFISTCNCGYNANGYSYCSPFLGDAPGVAYIAQWIKALASSQGTCNTARRYSFACLSLIGQLLPTTQASYLYHNFANVQGNDNCIKYTFTRAYWDLWANELTVGLLTLALAVGL